MSEWVLQKKLLTLVGLPVLLVLTWLGIYAVWGALFVYWGLLSMRSGQAFVFEEIERDENPILFWIIVLTWIGSGLLYILIDLSPQQLA